jgi:hypothetical protein
MGNPFVSRKMIAHFKNPVERKMNFQKTIIWGMVFLAGGIFTLLNSPVPAVCEESEDVQVIERKPDESNPAYEIITVEGGLIFRAPKDMTFVKQNGVIAPISTEEYCLRKFDGVEKQIETLNERIRALEEKTMLVPGKKNQASL